MNGKNSIQRKEEFLLNYHKLAWENINTHRDGLWKILVPYLGFYIAIKDIYDLLGALYIFLAFIILNTFVIAISINFNLWFVRNMSLIQNIESYFLEYYDYGKLIPDSWKVPSSHKERYSFNTLEIWMIIIIFILIIHIFTFILSFFILCDSQQICVILFFLCSIIILIVWYCNQKNRYIKFITGTIGYSIEN